VIALAVTILAGLLILDVALEVFRDTYALERRRQRDRDRAEILRTIDRTGGPR
jgi:hypothetical protein